MDNREILLLLIESPLDFTQLRKLTGFSGTFLIARLHSLMSRGLISRSKSDSGYVYRLTDKGLEEAVRYRLHKHLDYVFDKAIKEVGYHE